MKAFGLGLGALILSASGALFLMQCGDSNLGTSPDGGFGGDAAASCPTNPPTNGTACSLPNGTTCNNYPQPGCACCGAGGYTCENGTWTQLETAGAGAAPACPATLPEAGTTCPIIAGGCGEQPAQECSYTCDTGGNATASCGGGSWQIFNIGSCAGDGGLDAGDAGD